VPSAKLPPVPDYDVIVVGGGLFGLTAALRLARRYETLVLEEQADVLLGASYVNQNRLHSGFHYPRSLETALESIDAYESFEARFREALRPHENYYAVAAEGSETSPDEYDAFLAELRAARGLEYELCPSPPWILRPKQIAATYRVYEPVIDMTLVREDLKREVAAAERLTVRTGSKALELLADEPLTVRTADSTLTARAVVNTAYGNLNWHRRPASPRLEVQLVEMVELRSEERIPGITVVDGPFCAILPLGFSDSGYWFYSVNYGVHARVVSSGPVEFREPFYSNWERMRAQADRYFTFADRLTKVASWFTPRTFLADPEVERTKARPSVVEELEPGLVQVLGGKLVTCLRAAGEVERLVAARLG
jgi:glycine/D-amino acid oxidase-like deaminating enzyme